MLLEGLIALSAISIIVYLSSSIWLASLSTSQYDHFAALQFFHFVIDEVQIHQISHIDSNQINVITHSGDLITISQYRDQIRRQVNGAGHEILLRDVAKFTISGNANKVKINLEMMSGAQYEKIIVHYSQASGG